MIFNQGSSSGSRKEHLDVRLHQDSSFASNEVAEELCQLVKSTAEAGKRCVLGLATGSTPMHIYRKLVQAHKAGLSFSHVTAFNLDEYYPIEPDALQSYHRFMTEHLFQHVDIAPDAIHIPDGKVPASQVAQVCEEYEAAIQEAGGIDLQLLGLGRCGHIGFNERGSSRSSKTRLIDLDAVTRTDAAADFFGEENVPYQAITMGVETVLKARRIVVVAFGENKTGAVASCVEGGISDLCAASYLQEHENTVVHLDAAAAMGLTRVRSPWLVQEMKWDAQSSHRAVIWLAATLKKAILRLTDADYRNQSLQTLLAEQGPACKLNLRVFNHLHSTITEWPAGDPSQSEAEEPLKEGKACEHPRKILIMSPHPDDDVISCGGTFIRLVEQGHLVEVAYQTSGSIAVSDEEALRFSEFASQYQATLGFPSSDSAGALSRIRDFFRNKRPGQVDSDEVQHVKTQIRYSEARSAARVVGCHNLHFLNMPFYETGAVVKRELSREDVQIVVDLFQRLQPHQIYAAGDLSDPHGTHRTCLHAIMLAIEQVKHQAWFQDCQVWLYRGAWQEFEPHEIEMAVPITPAQLQHKIAAIFRHQSQKDPAMFPGADPREFWQRARDRNRATARVYNDLGLPEYEAMEAFVQYQGYRADVATPYFSGMSLDE